MNRVDIAEGILSRQIAWIASSDAKASFIFPVSAAMLGLIAALAPDPEQWTVASGIFSSIAAIMLVLSIAFCALSSFPRTSGPKGSVIFAEGITSRERSQYESDLKSISDDAYFTDLANQCHINATIAVKKFNWIKRSLMCLFIASAPWAIAIYLLYNKTL